MPLHMSSDSAILFFFTDPRRSQEPKQLPEMLTSVRVSRVKMQQDPSIRAFNRVDPLVETGARKRPAKVQKQPLHVTLLHQGCIACLRTPNTSEERICRQ